MTHAMAQKPVAQGVGGAVAIAALVGAAAGLLLAPKSGRETRQDLRKKMVEAQEKSKQMGQKAAEMKNKAMHKTGDMQSTATDKVDELRGKAEEAANSAKDSASEAKTQAEDVAVETSSRPRGRRTTL